MANNLALETITHLINQATSVTGALRHSPLSVLIATCDPFQNSAQRLQDVNKALRIHNKHRANFIRADLGFAA